MKLKTKIWLVSQGLLILTACIIQLTFYHEIKYGPILGMAKRSYWEIISDAEPTIPSKILAQGIGPELYDGRLPVRRSARDPNSRGLAAYRLAARQEQGIRFALYGGVCVNILYLLAYHSLFAYFERTLSRAKKRTQP